MSRNAIGAAAYLMEAVASAPSADNAQPWCFASKDDRLQGYAQARGGFPVDYHATQLALGAAAENLAAALQAAGYASTDWLIAAPGADGRFFDGRVPLELTPPAAATPYPWIARHTNRTPYEQTALATPLAEALCAGSADGMDIAPLAGSAMDEAAGWVRAASEVRFQTREVNEWFAASLRYGKAPDAGNEGLHVDTLALPPGGVALLRLMSDWRRLQGLNALGAYKLFSRIEASNFKRAPLILAIVGDDRAFDAGRCLQRVWLKLTELGLSAQPYYVVSDLIQRLRLGRVPSACVAQAEAVTRAVGAQFGQGRTLHCLLRVGKPSRQTAVSGRLPQARLMCRDDTHF